MKNALSVFTFAFYLFPFTLFRRVAGAKEGALRPLGRRLCELVRLEKFGESPAQ